MFLHPLVTLVFSFTSSGPPLSTQSFVNELAPEKLPQAAVASRFRRLGLRERTRLPATMFGLRCEHISRPGPELSSPGKKKEGKKTRGFSTGAVARFDVRARSDIGCGWFRAAVARAQARTNRRRRRRKTCSGLRQTGWLRLCGIAELAGRCSPAPKWFPPPLGALKPLAKWRISSAIAIFFFSKGVASGCPVWKGGKEDTPRAWSRLMKITWRSHRSPSNHGRSQNLAPSHFRGSEDRMV